MLSLMVECNVLILKILYEMFQAQRITLQEFTEHTKVKIGFLNENIGGMITDGDKKAVADIIRKCSINPLSNYHDHNVPNYLTDYGLPMVAPTDCGRLMVAPKGCRQPMLALTHCGLLQ
jgi:hypothetical protein